MEKMEENILLVLFLTITRQLTVDLLTQYKACFGIQCCWRCFKIFLGQYQNLSNNERLTWVQNEIYL